MVASGPVEVRAQALRRSDYLAASGPVRVGGPHPQLEHLLAAPGPAEVDRPSPPFIRRLAVASEPDEVDRPRPLRGSPPPPTPFGAGSRWPRGQFEPSVYARYGDTPWRPLGPSKSAAHAPSTQKSEWWPLDLFELVIRACNLGLPPPWAASVPVEVRAQALVESDCLAASRPVRVGGPRLQPKPLLAASGPVGVSRPRPPFI